MAFARSATGTARGGESFRFSLSHVFKLLTIACVYCALVRSCGHYVAMHFIGIVMLAATLQLASIQGLVAGSLVGALSGVALSVLCALLCGQSESGGFVVSLFAAPLVGYAMGLATSVCALSRQGL